MDEKEKTKEQLLHEIIKLRERIAELELSGVELKGAEEELQPEKERFQVLVKEAPLGIAIIGKDNHYKYINPKFTDIFGYTLEDIPTGREWFRKAYPHEDYRKQVVSTWVNDMKTAKRGESRPRTFTARCKDGSEKVIYFRPVTMKSGDQFVMYDVITEREKAEEDLKKDKEHLEELVKDRTTEITNANKELRQEIAERRRAEETLRSFQSDLQEKKDSLELLNAIADKVYGSLDLQTVAEQAVASMMNYSQSPFVGIFAVNEEARCLEALYSIGFTEEVRQEIARVPLKGSLSGITVARKDIVTSENIRYDDRVEPGVEEGLLKQGFKGIVSVPLLFQDRVLGVINLFFKEQIPLLTDLERKTLINIGKTIGLAMANAQQVAQIRAEITERKRAEELLQRERETFYSTLQEAPNGVALIDKDGRYLYINSAFTNITGYTLEDIPTGRDWFRRAYPNQQYRHQFIELWKKDCAAHKAFDRTLSVVCKDGAVKEIEFRGTVLEDGRAIIMLSDITERVRTEDELRESEIRYKTLFDCAADAIFVHDLRGKFLDVNTVACERYGYSKEEFLQMTPQDVTTLGRAKNMLQRVDEIRTQGYFLYETVHVRRDGTMIPTEVSSQIIEYHGRSVVLSIARDITERKQAEEALRESETRLRKLFEAIPEAVMVHDEDGNILHINDVGAKRLEWSAEDLVGKNLREIIKPENATVLSDHARMARTDGSSSLEITYISRTGKYIVAEVNERPIELEGKSVILSVARDITERKRAEQQLAYIATHDALTGLPNRVLFNDRLNLALAQAQRHQQKLAVLLLDLDRFKDINDTLGHSVGDQLLRVTSRRLKGLLRKSDTLARMGGDEFLFLVIDIDRLENVTEVARKILGSFRAPFVIEDHELHSTASIGVTIFPDDGVDADTLLKNADIAMYSAKQKGRNNYQRYTSTMKARAIE
jgi:diguanylate cyclase (GGDEF)-like protein/PAS domain S-box-containing protein